MSICTDFLALDGSRESRFRQTRRSTTSHGDRVRLKLAGARRRCVGPQLVEAARDAVGNCGMTQPTKRAFQFLVIQRRGTSPTRPRRGTSVEITPCRVTSAMCPRAFDVLQMASAPAAGVVSLGWRSRGRMPRHMSFGDIHPVFSQPYICAARLRQLLGR